ncbi:methyltransferase domain-containing protein [Streptomyces sp. SP18BB07]|uniref:methyltransferase domain-containing protein n=1 Tax=Streptomyces sp. SP18BB07 TaxID=3002522 RepID=UPI002E79A6D7|nr:methyltransferase domain-containing protein [Streptomyces sp. SP18BB07]MEE1757873.1 methyltransferase domain-containing protein [Streptomyces sp. SP18BB07]
MVRRICLPPFRHLLDRLPALRVTDIYEDPFEPYLHQQTTEKTWDTDHFTAIARKRGGRALDIGCGRGRVALALAAADLPTTAVDISHAATTRLRTHLTHHPELAQHIRVVHGDVLDPMPELRTGYTTATLGDTAVNMFTDPRTLTAFLTRVRSLLTPDGILCLPVLTEPALAAYTRRNGVLATAFTDDDGTRRLLFAAMRHDPDGPHFSRTLFLPDATRDKDEEPVAHLAAVRERLWNRASLTQHLREAGFEIVDSIPVVPRHDALGRVDAEILVLAAEQEARHAAVERDLGAATVLLCDSSIPGRHDGQLDDETIGWLESELALAEAPVFVGMHHPPIALGLPSVDAIRLNHPSGWSGFCGATTR